MHLVPSTRVRKRLLAPPLPKFGGEAGGGGLLCPRALQTLRGRALARLAERLQNQRLREHSTGLGIPQDKLDLVFEPFVQLDRSLTSGHEGTGLGLAISRELARAMGGELSAGSIPGHGSTFTLSLPKPIPGETAVA